VSAVATDIAAIRVLVGCHFGNIEQQIHQGFVQVIIFSKTRDFGVCPYRIFKYRGDNDAECVRIG
jgi:hypothetical protein